MKFDKVTLKNISIKESFATAILILFLISLSIAGATYAYFIDASFSFENVFTAGTVDVDLYPFVDGDYVIISPINGCAEYRWKLKNLGTKSSYVRVKIVRSEIEVDGETAWALDVRENNIKNSFKELKLASKWGWVNDYYVGNETEYTLWAGAGLNDLSKGEEVGTVTVETLYDVDDNPVSLLVKYKIDQGFSMSEAHLHIDTVYPEPPVASGQFKYKDIFFNTSKYNFTVDLQQFGNLVNGYELKLAAHAVVAKDDGTQYMYQPSSLGEDCENRWFWWHEDIDQYGFWYYWDYNLDAVKEVVAGDELELCLLMCPLGSDNRSYNFHIEIEAIQSSNEAYKEWPKRVWQYLPAD